MQKRKFSLRRALKDSLGLWFRSLPWIAVLALPYALLTAVLDPLTSHWALYLTIGPWLTALLWGVGRRDKGLSAGWLAAMGQGIRLWPRFLGLGFMMGLCWMCGLVCLVLPVLYAMVVVSLAPTLACAEDYSAEDSLNKSYELTRPHWFRLLVFWGVLNGIGWVGSTAVAILLQGSGMIHLEQQASWTAGQSLAWHYPLLVVLSFSKLGGIAVLRQLTAQPAEPEEAGVGLNPSA